MRKMSKIRTLSLVLLAVLQMVCAASVVSAGSLNRPLTSAYSYLSKNSQIRILETTRKTKSIIKYASIVTNVSVKAKNVTKTKATLEISGSNNAYAYQLQYAVNKNFKNSRSKIFGAASGGVQYYKGTLDVVMYLGAQGQTSAAIYRGDHVDHPLLTYKESVKEDGKIKKTAVSGKYASSYGLISQSPSNGLRKVLAAICKDARVVVPNTLTGLKPKTRYYVRVRPVFYNTFTGKVIYGNWSKAINYQTLPEKDGKK